MQYPVGDKRMKQSSDRNVLEDGNRTPDWSESATEIVLTAIADTTNEWLISDISGIGFEYLLVRLDHHIG